jgi:hypothetical protein
LKFSLSIASSLIAFSSDRLKSLSEKWQPQQIIAEQNSIGQPVIEQFTREGLRIQSFTTTNASKAQAIEALALAFERSDIRILNDPVLVSELVAYQSERLPSGLLHYGAPGGQHDDTVMALGMAWTSAISGEGFNILGVKPALGRLIQPDDDSLADPHDVAVLSYPFWKRHYGGSPSAIGRTVTF